MTQDVTPPVAQAAERLRYADTMRRTCAPVRELIGRDNVEAAYAVQQHVVALREISGDHVVGRKVGLTARAVQDQLGVHEPTIGTLMESMQVHDGAVVPVRRLLQPLVEAEVVFRLGEDLDEAEVDPQRARSAVSEVLAGIEVVDSRIDKWDITRVDTIADNASAGLFVLAPEGRPIGKLDLGEFAMKLRCNGKVASRGSGADNFHGDPLRGLAWLAGEAHRRGTPLRAGQIVLAGALGPMVEVHEDDSFDAVIGDLPPVSVHFRSSVAAREAGVLS
ncbi:putative hydratase/decarboxylase [Flexivirga endophytica]|uniref:Hydratase/decarboxylase n=1 Tax=Flexivirga endophytica TaxID=1849103 RepID=A0A916WPX1_9MICO|nr:fumarylacetoacetate hydrolase family protein [Flexivirga endophytica]GGB18581.1 putative hydratase/decarboxylase [Flexivirga endophytica]GHB37103.1 putative hydratase/decarboxylase [Flexivirga endophytica]